MLDIFKQEGSFLTKIKEKKDLRYILDFDTNGAFINVADGYNKVISNIDYRVYNGIDREILQLLHNIKEKDFFTIDWDNDSDRVYLYKHPNILELLRFSNKLYCGYEPVSFDNGIDKINLKIFKKDKKLITATNISGYKDFKILTSNYILIENKIRQIYNIGENFNKIYNLNSVIDEDKIEEFLTILVTNFENIDIDYEDYKLIEKKESRVVKPAVIFEAVTSNNELVMRISATIARLTPEFFNSFSITKIAFIEEIEKNISIYKADFSLVFELYSQIYKILSSIKRKTKDTDFNEEDGLFILDDNIAKEFLSKHLQNILGKCELFGSEKLKKYKYNTTKPNLNISFKEKIDFLDSNDVNITIDSEEFDIFELIKLYKKHSYIPLNNGEKAIIEKSYINRLERIFKKDKNKIKVSFFDLPEIEDMITKKGQKVFKNSKKFYEGFNKLNSSKIRLPKIDATPRDYQKYGFKWLKYLYDNNFGGCLADDMGLGKTLQAIMLLSYIYPKTKEPTLIVMPRSLLNNWQNELKKFNPNLTFYIYYENQREVEKIKDFNITLTTYAMVRNDVEKLKQIKFDTIILDESQNIKNIDSKISKAVMLLEAKHKFALSGTPIENSLFELYSLFRFVNPGMFKGVNDFKKDFAIPIQSEANEEVAKVLKAKVSPFILRRLKQDVLKDLPPKQEQTIYIQMDKEHKEFYEKRRSYYKKILEQQISANGIENSKLAILQAFNDLRQIASAPELRSDDKIKSSKIEVLFENLEDIILNNHKVLIFANYLGSLDLIAQKADENGYKYLMMTGSTKNRQELVDKFQNDKSINLFLLTLKVGGVGLNLTEADYVFIFDPWWNKAAENQAVDRVHRIGQKNRVFSYKLITKDTIEAKIEELQNQKQDMADLVISSDEGGLKKLSSNDLDFILG